MRAAPPVSSQPEQSRVVQLHLRILLIYRNVFQTVYRQPVNLSQGKKVDVDPL